MPSDTRIDDGFPTTITFSLNEDIKLWPISVKPPGYDGGGPIETTTMLNTAKRTKSPKKLVSMTNSMTTMAYATSTLEDIQAMINIEQEITITYPEDGGTETFWGYINTFEPSELQEGVRPTASVEIVTTNQDDAGNEQAAEFA